MRKKLLLVLLSVMMVGVTGCVENIELDEEQEDKFLQYSVFAVLEHDKNYLVNLEQIDLDYGEDIYQEIPTENTTEQPTTDSSGNSSQGGSSSDEDKNTVTVSNLAQAIGVDGV